MKLAKCCTPVPGDQIMGFVTKGSGVSVHRTDCVNAASLRTEPERLIDVEWAPTAQSSFLVAIQVEALDRNRLLSDITRTLSDQHVNILSAALSTSKDRICKRPLHLRDRRPDAPGPRAARRPQRAGRLRRLPSAPVTGRLPASCPGNDLGGLIGGVCRHVRETAQSGESAGSGWVAVGASSLA